MDDNSAPKFSETPAPTYEATASGDPESGLPTYTETQNEAPPPTYESIYGAIKEAQRTSSGRGNFLKNVCTIILSTVGFTVFIAVMLSIPVLMIVIGSLNLKNCELEPLIPIWLIVFGVIGAIMQINSIGKRISAKCRNQTQSEAEADRMNKTSDSCNGCLGCFIFAWFIAGNVWVYRNYVPNTSFSSLSDYCDHTTYYLAFWLITIVYISMGLACCCSCCIAMCADSGSNSNEN